MTLGLYKVGENQPITRMRRGRTRRGHRLHLVPDCGPLPPAQQRALCGAELCRGETWNWADDGDDCKPCQSVARYELRKGALVVVDPAVVAEFERVRLANLGNRQAAAGRTQPEARLAVEIYRPRDGVMGSVGTRREIHLVDCLMVGTVERPMVPLPVSEVLRLKTADGGRVTFCQECKPFHVLDNERRRPRTMTEARKLSEREGYLARDRVRRTTANARHRRGFRLLPHDGSMHFEGCPAEPDALLNGNVTYSTYGRCTCYEPDPDEQPKRRPGDHGWGIESPEWTL